MAILDKFHAWEKAKKIAAGEIAPKPKKPGLREEIARLQKETDDKQAEIARLSEHRIIDKKNVKVMAASIWEGNPGLSKMSRKELDEFVSLLCGAWTSTQVRAAKKDGED